MPPMPLQAMSFVNNPEIHSHVAQAQPHWGLPAQIAPQPIAYPQAQLQHAYVTYRPSLMQQMANGFLNSFGSFFNPLQQMQTRLYELEQQMHALTAQHYAQLSLPQPDPVFLQMGSPALTRGHMQLYAKDFDADKINHEFDEFVHQQSEDGFTAQADFKEEFLHYALLKSFIERKDDEGNFLKSEKERCAIWALRDLGAIKPLKTQKTAEGKLIGNDLTFGNTPAADDVAPSDGAGVQDEPNAEERQAIDQQVELALAEMQKKDEGNGVNFPEFYEEFMHSRPEPKKSLLNKYPTVFLDAFFKKLTEQLSDVEKDNNTPTHVNAVRDLASGETKIEEIFANPLSGIEQPDSTATESQPKQPSAAAHPTAT